MTAIYGYFTRAPQTTGFPAVQMIGQQIVVLGAAGDSLGRDGQTMSGTQFIELVLAAPLTMTSIPQMPGGTIGQVVNITTRPLSSNCLLRDKLTAAGSGFQLNGQAIALRPGQFRSFVYYFDDASSTFNWAQLGQYQYENPGYAVHDDPVDITIDAFNLCSGVVLRTGTTANRQDTLPTGTNIVKTLGSGVAKDGSYYHPTRYINHTNFGITLLANTDTTFDANFVLRTIPPGQFRDMLIRVTSSTTAVMFDTTSTGNTGVVPGTITAHVGGGQVNASPIATRTSLLTTAGANDSARLPVACGGGGMPWIIMNAGPAAADIYPFLGDAIDGMAANTQISLAANTGISLEDAALGMWRSV